MRYETIAVLRLNAGVITSVYCATEDFFQVLQIDEDRLVGSDISAVFPDIMSSKGIFSYHNTLIHYVLCPVSEQMDLLFLVLQPQKEVSLAIYQATLDRLDIGVQIYDMDANLIFLNIASAKMSHLNRDQAIGKKLTDLYNTDEKHSSVLSTLRHHTIISYKMDDFETQDGELVSVLNFAFPFVDEYGNMVGVINLEYDKGTTQKTTKMIQNIQNIISAHPSSRKEEHRYYRFEDIIGHSKAMAGALDLARAAVGKDYNVLITGETGTGKELIAQSIYSADPFGQKFLAINCSTIPESLADSTLFGTVKGAFTGSIDSNGLFAATDGGTLFLDEIDSLSLGTQARLLRVLQEGTYIKVGSTKEIHCKVRILASCNQNPWKLMEDGIMRRDLFYRLASFHISLPPLRERENDLDDLVAHFLRYYSNKYQKEVTAVSAEAMDMLHQYSWPGNIRELKNFLEFSVSSTAGSVVEIMDFPYYLRTSIVNSSVLPSSGTQRFTLRQSEDERIDLTKQVEQYEMNLIREAMNRCGNNITKAAKLLSVSRQTLQHKLKRFSFQ